MADTEADAPRPRPTLAAVDGLLRRFAADMARVGNPDVQLNSSAMVRQQLAGQRACRRDDKLLGGPSDATQP